jgi:hypothetical protein
LVRLRNALAMRRLCAVGRSNRMPAAAGLVLKHAKGAASAITAPDIHRLLAAGLSAAQLGSSAIFQRRTLAPRQTTPRQGSSRMRPSGARFAAAAKQNHAARVSSRWSVRTTEYSQAAICLRRLMYQKPAKPSSRDAGASSRARNSKRRARNSKRHGVDVPCKFVAVVSFLTPDHEGAGGNAISALYRRFSG